MKLIVDANVLFSAFLKDGLTRRIILYNILQLYTPKFVIEEFFEHITELSNKMNVNKKILEIKIKEFLANSGIKLYSKKDIIDFLQDAKNISPDKDDIMYFAAALKLDGAIWSNDKKLKEQNKVKVYTTNEIIDILHQIE